MSKDELLDFLVSEGTTQEEAVRIIEDLGYEWRVASTDGVPQPTTRDYREDRVTMDIDAGIVVGARWEEPAQAAARSTRRRYRPASAIDRRFPVIPTPHHQVRPARPPRSSFTPKITRTTMVMASLLDFIHSPRLASSASALERIRT